MAKTLAIATNREYIITQEFDETSVSESGPVSYYEGSYTLRLVRTASHTVLLSIERFWYSCDRIPAEENNVIADVTFIENDTAICMTYTDGEQERIDISGVIG
jgi:hypothetical protein